MSLTLLAIVNRAQGMLNLPITSTVYNNTGDAQKQLVALSNTEGDCLVKEFPWQRLLVERTFATTATAQQTNETLPAAFDRVVNETLWNRTTKQPVYGPLSPRVWQAQQGIGTTSVWSSYRLIANSFYFSPTPTASQNIYYEYVSNQWCTSSGGTGQSTWAADTDLLRVPDLVMTLGVVWRFLEAKGFNYENRYDEYMRVKQAAKSADGTRRHLSIVGPPEFYSPGAPGIQDGNWSIT
jgi:hypothetical protein